MKDERRTILSLVAMGRISAAEAERLMTAGGDEREVVWIAAVCAVLCAAQSLGHGFGPEIGHIAHALGSGWTGMLHHAAVVIWKGVGGRL